MFGCRKSWGVAAVLSILTVAAPIGAADLIEPWAPGWSDLELFTTWEEGGRPNGSTTLGIGLDGGFSVGFSLAGGADPADVGLILVWSRDLGRRGELDLFAEANAATHEVELDGLGRSYGCEWSAPPTRPHRPYLRLTATRHDDGYRWHPLLGWNLPAGRLDLHLELSSEQPEPGGRWPLHLAIGPNLALTDEIELLPELSLLYDRATGELEPALTLGVVTTPAAVRALAERLLASR